MDDLERYGDYNEIDEPAGKRNPVLLFLKILVLVACFSVVGLLVFRVVLFSYYPSNMKSVYIDEELREAYRENGDLDIVTQDLRYAYDDPDNGNFFCDHLIVVKDIDRVQIILRFNVSALEAIEKKYGEGAADGDFSELLNFKLFRNNLKERANETVDETVSDTVGDYVFYNRDIVGEVLEVETDSFLMYRYYRIVFDSVDFDGADGNDIAQWLSLAVYVKDHENEAPYARVLIYENHEDYAKFEKVDIPKKELEK